MTRHGLEHVIGQWVQIFEDQELDIAYPAVKFAEWLSYMTSHYSSPQEYREAVKEANK